MVGVVDDVVVEEFAEGFADEIVEKGMVVVGFEEGGEGGKISIGGRAVIEAVEDFFAGGLEGFVEGGVEIGREFLIEICFEEFFSERNATGFVAENVAQ